MREDESSYPFWVEDATEGRARMGVVQAFLEELGEEVLGVELAPPETRLARGDTMGFLHTGTRTVDLRVPFGLEIIQINEEAVRDPRLVGRSAYGRGWLAEVRRGS